MALFSGLKAQKALMAQNKGNNEEAMRLYEEAFAGGVTQARYVLSYAVLLIRGGEFQKAKDLLVKHQKDADMKGDSRNQLIIYYAVCSHKLGNTDAAISKLEELQRKGPGGLLYQTLGYLYVEKYDVKNTPDFTAIPAPEEEPAAPVSQADAPGAANEEDAPPEKPKTPEQLWQEGREKALSYNLEAVDYDEEDSVCLDNLAQVYYRVMNDKANAKIWFDKAHAVKESQIDTLWFLSRYDLEKGDTAVALTKLKTAVEGRFSPLNFANKPMIEAEIARLQA